MILISSQPVIRNGPVIISGIETTGEHVHKNVVNTPSIQHSGPKIIYND